MNNKAQFTPGPWVVTEHSAGMICVAGPNNKDLCAVGYNRTEGRNDVANANLIAAAPAMYEALKALHSVLDQRMPDGRTLNQHLSREVFECFYGPAIAARVAIAKAEGA